MDGVATAVLVDSLADSAVGDDTVTFNSAWAIRLAQAAFAPSPTLVVGDLTEATFDGYAEVDLGAAGPTVSSDPGNGDVLLTFPLPVGGLHWQCTGGTGLPQTIFGWYAVNQAGTILYASGTLEAPVVISASGQSLDLDYLRLRLPLTGINFS